MVRHLEQNIFQNMLFIIYHSKKLKKKIRKYGTSPKFHFIIDIEFFLTVFEIYFENYTK